MQVDQLAQVDDRRAGGVALHDGPTHLVAEDVEVRRAAVDQADRDSGVDGMQDRALPLDPEEIATLAALHHEPLGGAGEEV